MNKTIHRRWAIVLIMAILAGCTTVPMPLETPMTPFQYQGERGGPLVQGEISGVGEDALVTVYRHTPAGRQAGYFTRRGDGLWEVTLSQSDPEYVVTAEAPGYSCEPISYTVRVSGETAYLVQDGQLVVPALSVDFHFVPKGLR
jgi:hypothetical protein